MTTSRLASLTVLAVVGAVCAGTAATVYVAASPSRDRRAGATAGATPTGADPADAALRRLPPDRAADRLADGACLHLREMLFGVSPERWRALEALRAASGDAGRRAHVALAAFDRASLDGRLEQCRAGGTR